MASKENHVMAGVVLGSILLGVLIGVSLDRSMQESPKKQTVEASPIQGGARDLVLEALRVQAKTRAANAKYDASQRETIRLLIPAMLDELSKKPLSVTELDKIYAVYGFIELPDGLRAVHK